MAAALFFAADDLPVAADLFLDADAVTLRVDVALRLVTRAEALLALFRVAGAFLRRAAARFLVAWAKKTILLLLAKRAQTMTFHI